MENLTHTLAGLMLSRAGCNKLSPRASLLMMFAANFPDADGIVRLWSGSLGYLDFHRGITHSLLAAPVMGALSVAIVSLATRQKLPFLPATAIATLSVLSHLILDWTNTYGIRMLLPFSPEWLHLDITNVVDFGVWTILLLAVIGPLLSRLVSSEIGAKPSSGRGAAITALLALSAYEAARFSIHTRAINTLNSHHYQGQLPRRVAAFPHFANPFLWNGYVELDNAIILQQFNLLFPYDPTAGRVLYKLPPSPTLAAARQTSTISRFLNFAHFPHYQITAQSQPPGAVKVEVMDLRFGDPSAPRFVASALIDSSHRVLSESYGFGPLRLR